MLINSSTPDDDIEGSSASDDLVSLFLNPVRKAFASSVLINSSPPDDRADSSASDNLVMLSLSPVLAVSIGAGDDGGAVESDGGDDKVGAVVGEGYVGGGGGAFE